jgi:beta-N-acetylhexosaminidase
VGFLANSPSIKAQIDRQGNAGDKSLVAIDERMKETLMRFTRRGFIMSSGAVIGAPYVMRPSAAVADAAIGQMFIVGFAGATADAAGAQNLARHIASGAVGGACFLGYNARSREGLEGLTRLFASAGRHSAPFIAIDQEGGAVQRLGPKIGYPAVPTAQAIAGKRDPEGAKAVYGGMARELRAAGFNFNMAPVADLGFEARNPVVTKWGRCFGADGATVARYAGACIAAHRQAGVLTALKHFPGHGSTLVDSHAKPVDITATWRPDEIEPYRQLSRSGLIDVVMTGHLAHAKLTGGDPATLSRQAIAGLLRRDIGYDGAVITDDLDMAAIRSRYDLADAVVRAIAAGNDLVLLSNSATPDPELPLKMAAAVRDAIVQGRLPAARIEEAGQRIAALRARLA